MKVQYCMKYQKYVSVYHCEFFNEGTNCKFTGPYRWNSIKDLLEDGKRPKKDVHTVSKPFHCGLLDRASKRRANDSRAV